MNQPVILRALAVIAVLLTGCAATVGTDSGYYVPPTAAATCQAQCRSMTLELGAVVVMANNVGCVCQPKSSPTTSQSSAAVTGGMAALTQLQQQKNRQVQQGAKH